MNKISLQVAFMMICFSCLADAAQPGNITLHGGDAYYPRVESAAMPEPDMHENIVPDFSRVGYRWGDATIPKVSVVVTVKPPEKYADARSLIQNAIDRVSTFPLRDGHRGAILLKAGQYRISGPLYIKASGVVLRGEGTSEQGTVLVATARHQHNLIHIQGIANMKPLHPEDDRMNIKDDYVPVGRFWVRVTDPKSFGVGDQVILYRPPSEQWIKDLKMDRIEDRPTTRQWKPDEYIVRMERVITMIKGDTIHFDNPCVMALDIKYGGGAVFKYSYENRINECGVENMLIRSEYAHDTDEEHGWSAVSVIAAEHCWLRDIHSEFFGFGLVNISKSAKNITVSRCECREAKSMISGGRRYSFSVNGSLNLVINCVAFDGRHDYATGAQQAGPNVFVHCTADRTHSDIGPHHRWNMGSLYDNIHTTGTINVQDRGPLGTGHGWAGANQVLWNCAARQVTVQNPWVSALNYSIGSVAQKHPGRYKDRLDGIWISEGQHVYPGSLYDAQLDLRRKTYPGGIFSIGVCPTFHR